MSGPGTLLFVTLALSAIVGKVVFERNDRAVIRHMKALPPTQRHWALGGVIVAILFINGFPAWMEYKAQQIQDQHSQYPGAVQPRDTTGPPSDEDQLTP